MRARAMRRAAAPPLLLLALLGAGCLGDPPAAEAEGCPRGSGDGCGLSRAIHFAFNDCAWLEGSFYGDPASVQQRLPPGYVADERGGTVLLGLQILDCGSAVLDNETVLRGPVRTFFLWTPIVPPTPADRDDSRVDDYPLEVFANDPALTAGLNQVGLPARFASIGTEFSQQPFEANVSMQGARIYTMALGGVPLESDGPVVRQRIHSVVQGVDHPLNLTSSGFLAMSGQFVGALLHEGGEVAELAFPATNPVPVSGHVYRGRFLMDQA